MPNKSILTIEIFLQILSFLCPIKKIRSIRIPQFHKEMILFFLFGGMMKVGGFRFSE